MADPLARVRRAAKTRAKTDAEWRDAIRAARAEGKTLRQIAEAAGVSNVAVLNITRQT